MKDNLYSNKLKEFLVEKGYNQKSIVINKYKYGKGEFSRVEVIEQDYVIQAFLIMTVDEREQYLSQHINDNTVRYPFYRSYSQQNPFGNDVNPACAIAVYEYGQGKEEIWHFYSASDILREYNVTSFINYNLAKKRFDLRFGKKTINRIKSVLYISGLIQLLLFTINLLSSNGYCCKAIIPFDSTTVLMINFVTFILLLPTILPYVDSISLPGISVGLKKQKE